MGHRDILRWQNKKIQIPVFAIAIEKPIFCNFKLNKRTLTFCVCELDIFILTNAPHIETGQKPSKTLPGN